MGFVIKCPICQHKVPWQPASEKPPICPSCHENLASDRDDSDVVMPFIRSSSTKANDDVYRQIERTSEVRAERAAEMAGVPVSEMSGMKVTNLKENRGYGDVMAVPEQNDVTRFMAANPQTSGFGIPGAVPAAMPAPLEASSRVGIGPFPNAGARAQSMVRQMHANSGQGHAVGDNPALETQQPGYRRRV